ncbi:MAG: hypothetical protein IJE49_13025 [Agathobacter sp.]|nr:hypothetical protein [Agathobacter sp.]
MRKRIKQLARGKFEYAKPELILSEEEIAFTVIEGTDYEGSFTFENPKGIKLRGLVYSTHPRMEVLTPQFEGEQVRIRYQFHSYGLSEGLTEKGDFVIVCNQREISLSFCASISKKYVETSIGPVKNLYDFSCLAKADWNEAFQLFYNKNFSNIIKPNEVKESMIYRGIITAKPCNQNMEEFLIGIRKKEKISFKVEKNQFEFSEVTDTLKETIEIKKDNWGYLEINASCDAEFIRLPKSRIRTEDFIGSTYSFPFFIEPDKLHAGRNFARIQFSSVYETINVEIVADARAKQEDRIEETLEIKECLAGIMELYQAYRLKRIVTGVWANETISILDHLRALEPEEPMHRLMKAQCLIINRQRQEAEWILDEFKREWVDRKAPVWGYYLYIMTLMEREPSYVDKLTKEIEAIFHENPDSVMLFWVLTFLQEKYIGNNALKLKDIEYWVMKGCSSPYLYLEAYYLIWQDPYLLTKLDAFEIRVLRWAVRRRAITKDIAIQIFQIMETCKDFSPVLYQLLCAAYEANPKPEYVGVICGYLIKSQQYDSKYHHWYEKGIELELRITSLYEAYLLSMDERKVDQVPKIIQMYFQYDCGLPYKKMAVLYNNIIASKAKNPEVYQKYCRVMGRFAMDQILAGHMDDNLAVVYDDMLDLGVINQEISKALSYIIFTHKVVVFDKRMVRAIIYQRQMKDPQIVPIVDNMAYFQLYSKEYVIVFEDEKGRRYSGSIAYQMQNLMDAQKYLEKCMELTPLQLPYLISYFDTRQNYLTFEKEDKKHFKPLMFSEAVSAEYKAKLLPEILRFYQVNAFDATVEEYLMKADYKKLDEASRRFAMELCVENHLFDFAYDKVMEYGIDQIGSAAKVALASYMIEQTEYEEDEFLLNLSITAFRAKKYNDKMLKYLCMHFNGSTQDMLDVWFAAKNFDVERFDISERILVQMLYADTKVLEGMPVFAYFYETGGKDFITLAYISDCAHRYFVKNQKIDTDIFELIEARYIYNFELNDACKLALLKYYADLANISERQLAIEDELLAEYTRRNMLFAFFKRLAPELVLKYHLYDKVFLEYRTNPHSHVVLHYSRDEDGDAFLQEDMLDVYDGIFVKTFVIFFGEVIQYYISEEHGNEVEVTQSNRIVNNDVYNKNDESRYNLLNQMLISNTLQEEEELYQAMKQYAGLEEVTQKVFKLL